MPTPGIDFFRVDRSSSTRRTLLVAALLVAFGATSMGAHLVHRLGDFRHILSLAGGLSVAAGLILGFGVMAMMLFEDVYLTIEDANVRVHEGTKEIAIVWDDLDGIDVDAKRGFVDLKRKSGDAVRFHAGASAKNVAERVEDARRKAALGIPRRSS